MGAYRRMNLMGTVYDDLFVFKRAGVTAVDVKVGALPGSLRCVAGAPKYGAEENADHSGRDDRVGKGARRRRRPLQRKKRDGHLMVAAAKKDRGVNPRLESNASKKASKKRKH